MEYSVIQSNSNYCCSMAVKSFGSSLNIAVSWIILYSTLYKVLYSVPYSVLHSVLYSVLYTVLYTVRYTLLYTVKQLMYIAHTTVIQQSGHQSFTVLFHLSFKSNESYDQSVNQTLAVQWYYYSSLVLLQYC